jgi:hypothetical protein
MQAAFFSENSLKQFALICLFFKWALRWGWSACFPELIRGDVVKGEKSPR